MRRVRVAAVSAGTDHFKDGNPGPERNFARLRGFALQSLEQKPDIIVFPEFAIPGKPYSYDRDGEWLMKSSWEPVPGDGKYYREYAELARGGNCFVCGWLTERDGELAHNTSFIVNRQGDFVGKYRKVHPTFGEEEIWNCRAGTEHPVFDLGIIKVGIQICWDMQFPEGCRILMLKGAQLILHPTVVNDRRDICPVRCKENGIPMVISIFSDSSYGLDDSGRVIADLADRQREGGFLIADYYPDEVRLESKYGCHRCAREIYLARRNPAAYRELIDPATRPRLEQVMRHADGSPLTPEEIKSHFPYYQAGSENRL